MDTMEVENEPVGNIRKSSKYMDILHSAPTHNTAGDYYLILQGSTGDAVFEFAKNKDTWDEIAVQLTGDITQANWIREFTSSASNTTIVGHSLGGSLAQYFRLRV